MENEQILKEYLQSIKQNFDDCYSTLNAKREDYTGGVDPFENFRESAAFADVAVSQAIQVLIGTKIARLKSLINGDKKPNNESVHDTILDMMNYLNILDVWLSRDWDIQLPLDFDVVEPIVERNDEKPPQGVLSGVGGKDWFKKYLNTKLGDKTGTPR